MKARLFPKKLVDLFCKEFFVPAYGINNGWCHQFAYLLKRIDKRLKVVGCWCHVWVELDGKCYDSDHPYGLHSKDEYGLCLGNCCEFGLTQYKTLKAIALGRTGDSGPVNIKSINKIVRKFKS